MGSFKCICDRGYELDSTGNACIGMLLLISILKNQHFKQFCLLKDKNECKQFPKVCEFDCVNTEGSFYCICGAGYRLSSNKKSCIDIDECSTRNNTCPKFCSNTPGGYKCLCPAGYIEKFANCIDIDECSISPNLCGPQGECINTIGKFKCQCQSGYKVNPEENYCIGKANV
jgi:hypothetical protein